MSIAELGRLIGVERSTLNRMELGEYRIPASLVPKIARALRVPVQKLFDGE